MNCLDEVQYRYILERLATNPLTGAVNLDAIELLNAGPGYVQNNTGKENIPSTPKSISAELHTTNPYTPPPSISPKKCASHIAIALPRPEEMPLSLEQVTTSPKYTPGDHNSVSNFVFGGTESVSPIRSSPRYYAESNDSEQSSDERGRDAVIPEQRSPTPISIKSGSSSESVFSVGVFLESSRLPTPKIAVPDPAVIARLNYLDGTADWSLLNSLVKATKVATTEQDDPKALLTVEKVETYIANVVRPDGYLYRRSKYWYKRLWNEKSVALRAQYKLKAGQRLPKQVHKGLKAQCQQEADEAVKVDAAKEHDLQIDWYRRIMATREQAIMDQHAQISTKQEPAMARDLQIKSKAMSPTRVRPQISYKQRDALAQAHNLDLERMDEVMKDSTKQMFAPSPKVATREDVLRKIQEQTERCGIPPMAAMGGFPAAPSSVIERKCAFILSTLSMNHPNEHEHSQTPYRSQYSTRKRKTDTFDLDETEDTEDSDRTIDDPNRSDSEDDSNMPPEKKKNASFQAYGPKGWMLDPNRADPVAVAARNNRAEDLDKLMVAPPQAEQIQARINRSSRTSESQSTDSRTPTPRSAKPRIKLPDWQKDSNSNIHLRGGYIAITEEEVAYYDRSDDLERLRAARRIRDDDEMYRGLRDFKGSQRGWNGKLESIHAQIISEYSLAADRCSIEQYHKGQGAQNSKSMSPKGKEPTTPRNDKFPEPDYTGFSREERIKGMGDHVEAGYKMLIQQVARSEAEWDTYMEEESRNIKLKMMSRAWDLDAIKQEVLAEQRARVKKSKIVKLSFSDWARLRDSNLKKRKELVDGLSVEANAKRARVE